MAEASSGLPPSAPASGSGGGGVGATTSGPTAPSAPTLGTAPDGVQLSVQLSRFHLETLEGSATGDVDLRGLCLSVGNRDLLVDAHLSLKRGVRYVRRTCTCMVCGIGTHALLMDWEHLGACMAAVAKTAASCACSVGRCRALRMLRYTPPGLHGGGGPACT